MLMRALFVHIAHETAGAARIRHSLRPLNRWGRKNPSKARAQRVAGLHFDVRQFGTGFVLSVRLLRDTVPYQEAQMNTCRILQCSKSVKLAPAKGQWRSRRLLCNGAVGHQVSGPEIRAPQGFCGRQHA